MKRSLLVLLLASAAACGESSDCEYPASQQRSQPCCPSLGIDACGAELVCAALDGRTVATCYPEGSREPMTGCTDSKLCASGSCNLTEHKCQSELNQSCDAAVGCAPTSEGYAAQCVLLEGTAAPQCIGKDLPSGAACSVSQECQSGRCLVRCF
jgi:hypothetical protein